MDEMNDRTCIVTRRQSEPDELIRFVVGPDKVVVPDIKRNLPGRGCWVTADRLNVDKAAKKNAFAKAFKAEVTVPPDLGGMVDMVLARSALGALGLARKAGAVALGATKVEASIRSGAAVFDGIRRQMAGRREFSHYRLEAELSQQNVRRLSSLGFEVRTPPVAGSDQSW